MSGYEPDWLKKYVGPIIKDPCKTCEYLDWDNKRQYDICSINNKKINEIDKCPIADNQQLSSDDNHKAGNR